MHHVTRTTLATYIARIDVEICPTPHARSVCSTHLAHAFAPRSPQLTSRCVIHDASSPASQAYGRKLCRCPERLVYISCRMASACELLFRFARSSARLEGRNVDHVEKLCVLSEDFLQMEARSFIVESSDNTLLLWYACDSTPLKVRRSYRRKVNLLEVHRSGKGCVD